MKIVAAIGRWMPIHNGHKKFLLDFLKEYDKVIILIGSCYESGTPRNCITAVKREKMINAVLKDANIPKDKYEIIPIPDTEKFDDWFESIKEICEQKGVTHFCTGNKKDILDILEEKGEKLKFEIINPEEKSDFPYHASDIRKLILEGEYKEVENLVPKAIKSMLFEDIYKDIIDANQNRGIKFGKGKQTSYIIFVIKNISDNKYYVLHIKDKSKVFSFPGGEIRKFENPISTAIRCLYEDSGIKVSVIDNSKEPAIVKFPNFKLENLYNLGVYNFDEYNETAQWFCIYIEEKLNKFDNKLNFCEIEKIFDDKKYKKIIDNIKNIICYNN